MKRAALFVAVLSLAAFVGSALTGGPASAESDPSRERLLARGKEVAESVVRCSQCHSTDRKATSGRLAYAGGRVEDWYAPAIAAAPDARLPWTEAELYTFLRTGSSPLHGVAAGSMSRVVHGDLAGLPDQDIRALAAYFASLQGAPKDVPVDQVAAALEHKIVRSQTERRGEWLFVGYCVSCHFNKAEAQTAQRPELALNTVVTAPDPTNLIRVVLKGVTEDEGRPEAYMPGFGMLLSDRDVASIAAYLRAAYAEDHEPWTGLETRAAEIRRLKDPMR